jgi:hypothetical protein
VLFSRIERGKFCVIAETPVNKGLGMSQMSVAQLIHEIRLTHVSRDYPHPVLQLAALKKASRKQVFKYDGLSGATTKRPALLRCLKKLEPGDNVHIATIYRLSKTAA